jgi:hypothetical protein
MRRIGIAAALMLFPYCPKGRLEAAENLRAASSGFTTAIHAVLWAANTDTRWSSLAITHPTKRPVAYLRNCATSQQGFAESGLGS